MVSAIERGDHVFAGDCTKGRRGFLSRMGSVAAAVVALAGLALLWYGLITGQSTLLLAQVVEYSNGVQMSYDVIATLLT